MCQSLYGRLGVSRKQVHQILAVRAGIKTRLFCNDMWCSYDEIVKTDVHQIEEAARDHESLNNA